MYDSPIKSGDITLIILHKTTVRNNIFCKDDCLHWIFDIFRPTE